MNRTIVIAFSTVDGIIEEPDGTSGTPNGRYCLPPRAGGSSGGQVQVGSVLDSGVLYEREARTTHQARRHRSRGGSSGWRERRASRWRCPGERRCQARSRHGQP